MIIQDEKSEDRKQKREGIFQKTVEIAEEMCYNDC